MGKRKTLEQFLNEAKTVHPELDFSLVNEYIKSGFTTFLFGINLIKYPANKHSP